MLTNILLYSLLFHFVLIEWVLVHSNGHWFTAEASTTKTKDFNITKPGCKSKCGDLTVPYPFGIGLGSGCSMYPWFDINCNTSFNPPKPFSSTTSLEVMKITYSQVRIKNRVGLLTVTTNQATQQGERQSASCFLHILAFLVQIGSRSWDVMMLL